MLVKSSAFHTHVPAQAVHLGVEVVRHVLGDDQVRLPVRPLVKALGGLALSLADEQHQLGRFDAAGIHGVGAGL